VNTRALNQIPSLEAIAMRYAIPAAALLGFLGTFIPRCQAEYDFSHYVTSSMDVSGVTWYEKGLIGAPAGVGLPAPGIITVKDDPTSTFLLQPYDANNILRLNLLKQNQNTFQPTGTLTLSTPTPARSLAFAVAGADSDTTLAMTVHFSDGTPDFVTTLTTPDWTNGGSPRNPSVPVIVDAGGRAFVSVQGSDANFLNGPSNDPQILEEIVNLPFDTTHPVASIDLQYPDTQMIPVAGVFGVSTSSDLSGKNFIAAPLNLSSFNADVVIESSAVPEPTAVGIMLLIAAPLLTTRRRITSSCLRV
jgi:hypothetical protein